MMAAALVGSVNSFGDVCGGIGIGGCGRWGLMSWGWGVGGGQGRRSPLLTIAIHSQENRLQECTEEVKAREGVERLVRFFVGVTAGEGGTRCATGLSVIEPPPREYSWKEHPLHGLRPSDLTGRRHICQQLFTSKTGRFIRHFWATNEQID